MKKVWFLIAALVFLGGFSQVEAQLKRNAVKKNNKRMSNYRGQKRGFPKQNEYNMIGITLNALNYYGDIAPQQKSISTDWSQTKPAFGLVLAHRFGPRFTVTGSFMYGTLKGSDRGSADPNDEVDAARYVRNLSFRNRISELSAVASMDLWDNQNTYLTREKWTPYAYAGISIFYHNPKAQAPQFQVDGVTPLAQAGEWVSLNDLGTEGQNGGLAPTDVNYGIKKYSLFQIAIPMGLGVRYKLNQLMDLSFEMGIRYLFTDYIDDVSQNYVDLGVFGDDELARAMSYRSGEVPEAAGKAQPYVSAVDGKTYYTIPGTGREGPYNIRGDKGDNDMFMVTSLKLTYIFGKTFNRAKFR